MKAFDIPCTLMADISDSFDSPLTGTYNPYPGGTPLAEAADALNAHATIALQQYSTKETMKWIAANTDAPVETLPMPIGVRKTDELLMKISELFGKPVPQELKDERGRAVDAMTDAHQYLHNKKFAIYGDPDWLLGIVSFLLEMGARPYHILCSRSTKKFAKEMQSLLDTSPYGADCNIWINKDLWHLRSLCATDPVDALIGDAHGKFITRDLGIPLIRAGFPIMDRVNLHRYPTIGYQGAINLLTWIANTFLDQVDVTCEDRNFEMMR
jgi:nitrogenase molybdenum-iron protein beta chain